MGLANSKPNFLDKGKIDESTSNTSLSNLRFVLNMDKPKWMNMFWRRKVLPVQTFSATSRKLMKGCVCGNLRPCKQKITPKGVVMHYPRKKRPFENFRRKKPFPMSIPKNNLCEMKPCLPTKIDFITHKKFPAW